MPSRNHFAGATIEPDVEASIEITCYLSDVEPELMFASREEEIGTPTLQGLA